MLHSTRNICRKYGARIAAVPAVLGVAMGNAFAEVPAGVTTALTDAKADALTIAGLAFAILIAIVGFAWMRRAVK
ncbi:hypothetical protein dqs_2018 [Azoarcus olearius]|uniref:major capsid protein n=1 Tax=Azoarcus sp. (strain BH72) TaxID=418699 RepID=UPI0008062A03|nr:major capsid protein [Azoarcus olearius]ANQ85056.1 hypothetical protein dqs_2018 [Azoarcus olearius]